MKRLYFLLPNPESACQVVQELEQSGVRSSHIHAAARHGSEVPCIHQATLLQTSQFGRGLGLGLVVGGVAGWLGGWLAKFYPPPSLEISSSIHMICTALGAALGAMLGGTISQDRLNPEILPYEGAILSGKVLLIVNTSSSEIETITALVRIHHPEVVPDITSS